MSKVIKNGLKAVEHYMKRDLDFNGLKSVSNSVVVEEERMEKVRIHTDRAIRAYLIKRFNDINRGSNHLKAKKENEIRIAVVDDDSSFIEDFILLSMYEELDVDWFDPAESGFIEKVKKSMKEVYGESLTSLGRKEGFEKLYNKFEERSKESEKAGHFIENLLKDFQPGAKHSVYKPLNDVIYRDIKPPDIYGMNPKLINLFTGQNMQEDTMIIPEPKNGPYPLSTHLRMYYELVPGHQLDFPTIVPEFIKREIFLAHTKYGVDIETLARFYHIFPQRVEAIIKLLYLRLQDKKDQDPEVVELKRQMSEIAEQLEAKTPFTFQEYWENPNVPRKIQFLPFSDDTSEEEIQKYTELLRQGRKSYNMKNKDKKSKVKRLEPNLKPNRKSSSNEKKPSKKNRVWAIYDISNSIKNEKQRELLYNSNTGEYYELNDINSYERTWKSHEKRKQHNYPLSAYNLKEYTKNLNLNEDIPMKNVLRGRYDNGNEFDGNNNIYENDDFINDMKLDKNEVPGIYKLMDFVGNPMYDQTEFIPEKDLEKGDTDGEGKDYYRPNDILKYSIKEAAKNKVYTMKDIIENNNNNNNMKKSGFNKMNWVNYNINDYEYNDSPSLFAEEEEGEEDKGDKGEEEDGERGRGIDGRHEDNRNNSRYNNRYNNNNNNRNNRYGNRYGYNNNNNNNRYNNGSGNNYNQKRYIHNDAGDNNYNNNNDFYTKHSNNNNNNNNNEKQSPPPPPLPSKQQPSKQQRSPSRSKPNQQQQQQRSSSYNNNYNNNRYNNRNNNNNNNNNSNYNNRYNNDNRRNNNYSNNRSRQSQQNQQQQQQQQQQLPPKQQLFNNNNNNNIQNIRREYPKLFSQLGIDINKLEEVKEIPKDVKEVEVITAFPDKYRNVTNKFLKQIEKEKEKEGEVEEDESEENEELDTAQEYYKHVNKVLKKNGEEIIYNKSLEEIDPLTDDQITGFSGADGENEMDEPDFNIIPGFASKKVVRIKRDEEKDGKKLEKEKEKGDFYENNERRVNQYQRDIDEEIIQKPKVDITYEKDEESSFTEDKFPSNIRKKIQKAPQTKSSQKENETDDFSESENLIDRMDPQGLFKPPTFLENNLSDFESKTPQEKRRLRKYLGLWEAQFGHGSQSDLDTEYDSDLNPTINSLEKINLKPIKRFEKLIRDIEEEETAVVKEKKDNMTKIEIVHPGISDGELEIDNEKYETLIWNYIMKKDKNVKPLLDKLSNKINPLEEYKNGKENRIVLEEINNDKNNEKENEEMLNEEIEMNEKINKHLLENIIKDDEFEHDLRYYQLISKDFSKEREFERNMIKYNKDKIMNTKFYKSFLDKYHFNNIKGDDDNNRLYTIESQRSKEMEYINKKNKEKEINESNRNMIISSDEEEMKQYQLDKQRKDVISSFYNGTCTIKQLVDVYPHLKNRKSVENALKEIPNSIVYPIGNNSYNNSFVVRKMLQKIEDNKNNKNQQNNGNKIDFKEMDQDLVNKLGLNKIGLSEKLKKYPQILDHYNKTKKSKMGITEIAKRINFYNHLDDDNIDDLIGQNNNNNNNNSSSVYDSKGLRERLHELGYYENSSEDEKPIDIRHSKDDYKENDLYNNHLLYYGRGGSTQPGDNISNSEIPKYRPLVLHYWYYLKKKNELTRQRYLYEKNKYENSKKQSSSNNNNNNGAFYMFYNNNNNNNGGIVEDVSKVYGPSIINDYFIPNDNIQRENDEKNIKHIDKVVEHTISNMKYDSDVNSEDEIPESMESAIENDDNNRNNRNNRNKKELSENDIKIIEMIKKKYNLNEDNETIKESLDGLNDFKEIASKMGINVNDKTLQNVEEFLMNEKDESIGSMKDKLDSIMKELDVKVPKNRNLL